MNTTERNYAWYRYNGVEGILAYDDCEKVQGIEPVQKGYSDNINFYSFESLEGVEITADDVCGTLSDCYDVDCAEKGGEIGVYLMTNPENEQSSLYAWEYDDVHEDDEAVRELNTYTNQYYDWRSELTSFVDAAIHNDWETKEELEKEWKEISKNYTFHLSDPLDFEEIWRVIDENRNE